MTWFWFGFIRYIFGLDPIWNLFEVNLTQSKLFFHTKGPTWHDWTQKLFLVWLHCAILLCLKKWSKSRFLHTYRGHYTREGLVWGNSVGIVLKLHNLGHPNVTLLKIKLLVCRSLSLFSVQTKLSLWWHMISFPHQAIFAQNDEFSRLWVNPSIVKSWTFKGGLVPKSLLVLAPSSQKRAK